MIRRQNFWYAVQASLLFMMGFNIYYESHRRENFSTFENVLLQKGCRFIIINKFVLDRKSDMYIRKYELWSK